MHSAIISGCGTERSNAAAKIRTIFAARAGEDRAAKPRAGEANEEDAVELGLPPSQSSGRSEDTDEEDADVANDDCVPAMPTMNGKSSTHLPRMVTVSKESSLERNGCVLGVSNHPSRVALPGVTLSPRKVV